MALSCVVSQIFNVENCSAIEIGVRGTNPQTGPITIHCTAKLSAQCNYEYRFQFLQVIDD